MEENKVPYSFTQFLKSSQTPKKVIKVLFDIYAKLSSLGFNIQRCENLILQYLCLLFFSPNNIPSSNNNRFTNWNEVYNYYGNPEQIFLSIEDKSIPVLIKSLLNNKNQNLDNKLVPDQLNTIDWGPTADYLTKNYRWINAYIDSETTSIGLITLEIFDIIAARLKNHSSPSKRIRCEIYTPYRLAAYIAEESLIHSFNSVFANSYQFNSFSDLCQRILEREDELKAPFLTKLESIKILDPAVGTGVFLFAVANLLLNNLINLKPTISPLNLRLQILERNLFGIDIDPLAIRISIVKFWLWVFSQKDLQSIGQFSFKCNFYMGDALFGFQTLPLDYRNSDLGKDEIKVQNEVLDFQYDQRILNRFVLYEVSFPQDSLQELKQLYEIFPKFRDKPYFEYFILEGDRTLWNVEKDSLDERIKKYVHFSVLDHNSSAFNLYAVFSRPLDTQEQEIPTSPFWECKRFSIPNKFHWSNIRALAVPKFDLIFGNPPFVALTDLSMISRKLLRVTYPSIYTGNNDLSYFFISRALSALEADNGILAFILPKYIIHSVFAEKIRKTITESSVILGIYDLGRISIFRGSNIRNIILHLRKGAKPTDHTFNYHVYLKKGNEVSKQTYRIPQFNLKPEKWILIDPQKQKLLDNIKNNSNMMLKDVAKISKGIETGCDQVFAPKSQFFFSQVLKISRDHIKPWIKGKDIKRFTIINTGREVLFTPTYRKHDIKTNKKIMNYLEENKTILLNRSRVSEYYLWRIGDERSTMNWNSPKVVCPYKSSHNTFAIDWSGSLSSKDVIWIIPNDSFAKKDFLLYLVGLLNSDVLTFFALNSIKDLGGLYEYYPKQIQNFPLVVPKSNTQEYKSICETVSRLIKNQSNQQYEKLQNKLNRMIFNMYNLHQEEIDLIKEFVCHTN